LISEEVEVFLIYRPKQVGILKVVEFLNFKNTNIKQESFHGKSTNFEQQSDMTIFDFAEIYCNS